MLLTSSTIMELSANDRSSVTQAKTSNWIHITRIHLKIGRKTWIKTDNKNIEQRREELGTYGTRIGMYLNAGSFSVLGQEFMGVVFGSLFAARYKPLIKLIFFLYFFLSVSFKKTKKTSLTLLNFFFLNLSREVEIPTSI